MISHNMGDTTYQRLTILEVEKYNHVKRGQVEIMAVLYSVI